MSTPSSQTAIPTRLLINGELVEGQDDEIVRWEIFGPVMVNF